VVSGDVALIAAIFAVWALVLIIWQKRGRV
jgi:hypothetical protein